MPRWREWDLSESYEWRRKRASISRCNRRPEAPERLVARRTLPALHPADPRSHADFMSCLWQTTGHRPAQPHLLQIRSSARNKADSLPTHIGSRYASDESGRSEIYIQPFPAPQNGGSKTPISRDGGIQPRWRRDGKELFYFSLDGKLMAADVTEGRHSKPVFPEPCSNCLWLRSATMNRPCGFSVGMSLPTASGSLWTRPQLHPNPLQWC